MALTVTLKVGLKVVRPFFSHKRFWDVWRCVLLFTILLKGAMGGCSPLNLNLVPKSFDNGTAQAYLGISINKGWKFYAPPASSDTLVYAPDLEWKAHSRNVANLKILWPEGVAFSQGELTGHGYNQAVIVPLTLKAQDAQAPVHLKGTLTGLVCSHDQCQPVHCALDLKLAPNTPYPPADDQLSKIFQPLHHEGPSAQEGVSLSALVLLALLGGLILNFMPCVLPVLGVKLLILTKSASADGKFPVREFWMTAGGIFATFLMFACVTISLKALGETVGWGAHFQNPYFLSLMLVVLSLFSANLLGVFEVSMPVHPGWIASFNLFKRWKSFFSGVLCVLLATPCAAPFVGTAVGFAMARNFFDILVIFCALGLGFSAPYWVTALLPSHRLRLPRPGRWLVLLQRFLGVMLLATLGWIGFLFTTQQAAWFVGTIALLMVLVFICFVLLWRGYKKALLPLATALGGVLLSPVLQGLFHQKNVLNTPVLTTVNTIVWQDFAPHMIPVHVAKGQVVIVDITANWCVTCHMNKQLVLTRQDTRALLAQEHVVLMRGDWTRPSTPIAEFLKRFNKAAIPFNVVFGPNAPQGIVLPEILTKRDLIDAIHQARGANHVSNP